MTVREFLKEIEATYQEYFNGSACEAILYKGLGESICISCFLAADKNEVTNGYFDNDMIKARFWIHNVKKGITLDDEMPESVLLESQSKCFMVKPSVDYLYCDYENVSFRKTTGSPEKIINTLEKFFQKLNTGIKLAYNNNNTMDQFKELIELRLV